MDAVLQACGIRLSPAQLRQLWAYHTLLREGNADLNLTRVRNFDNMVLKLYADSMLPADFMELPSPLLDLGTGPGMPGIPLKIYRPRLEVILAESRGNRVAFLDRALDRLGLEGIRAVGSRITARFEEPVAGVITRAVETIGATLARVAGCLARDGLVIFMKGPHCAEEISEANARFAEAYSLVSDRPYGIPGTRHARRLVVYRRLDEPLYSRRARAMQGRPVRTIASGQNPVFKDLKRTLTGRGVRKTGQALVSGRKLVDEILAAHPDVCRGWVSRHDQPPPDSAAQLPWVQLPPELLRELDVFGTHAPAIRSAAAFGAAQAILLAESANPFHPKALRASGGTALSLPLRQGPALTAIPPELPIVALSADGSDIREAVFPRAFGLLIGLEGPGLPEAWRRSAVRIPIRPEVESLNAAAAMAVALYEWKRRMAG
ncbi:MAG: class I SAM-dependent methyltransferase [Desulfobacterales bacterium]|nr:class I SAM-dependent methyltransferase [Desulfobacterales bacterium]